MTWNREVKDNNVPEQIGVGVATITLKLNITHNNYASHTQEKDYSEAIKDLEDFKETLETYIDAIASSTDFKKGSDKVSFKRFLDKVLKDLNEQITDLDKLANPMKKVILAYNSANEEFDELTPMSEFNLLKNFYSDKFRSLHMALQLLSSVDKRSEVKNACLEFTQKTTC